MPTGFLVRYNAAYSLRRPVAAVNFGRSADFYFWFYTLCYVGVARVYYVMLCCVVSQHIPTCSIISCRMNYVLKKQNCIAECLVYTEARHVTLHDEASHAALHRTAPCHVESFLCFVPCGGFCCRNRRRSFNAFAKIGVRSGR